MSVIDSPKARDAEKRASKLRLELKEWERTFALAHDGRKAGRDDIKEHPDIGGQTCILIITDRVLMFHSCEIQALYQIALCGL